MNALPLPTYLTYYDVLEHPEPPTMLPLTPDYLAAQAQAQQAAKTVQLIAPHTS